MRSLVLALLLSCSLSACAEVLKPYTEIQLQSLQDFEYAGEQEAFSGANLLAKYGREISMNRLDEVYPLTEAHVRFCHQFFPECRMMPRLPGQAHEETFTTHACGLCISYSSSGHTLSAVYTGYGKSMNALSDYEWTLYEDGKKLFSAPMEYGSDGPIRSVDMVNGKLAVSFRRVVDLPASAQEIAKNTSDVYYDGEFFNERYGVEASHDAFSYNGKIGFIAALQGKEYVVYDGVPVSKSFDAIRTKACCATPASRLRLFDNGAFVFVGERNGYAVLTEIDLEQIHGSGSE